MPMLRRFTLAVPLVAILACEGTPPAMTAADGTVALSRAGSAAGGVLAFAPGAHPYGRSMIDWTEAWWRWELSIPTAHNPGLDLTGADCAQGQSGTVWNLAPIFMNGSLTRNCAVPEHRALLVSLSGILNDYPCPDPTFQPAPGQSLQEFLTAGARSVVDLVNGLSLTVDGQSVGDPFRYRSTTPLFEFIGDPTLASSIDGCITGAPQPAVADGFLVMLKPLHPGSHTVVFTASDTHGTHTSVTYHLTVAGGD
jgi:hypothetical protein